MKISRRAMIKDGLLVVSAGMVMPAIFSRGIASARAQALEGSHIAQTANGRTLIVVQMAGGNDGLNTVIPFSDSLYHQVRPTLAIPDAQVLPAWRTRDIICGSLNRCGDSYQPDFLWRGPERHKTRIDHRVSNRIPYTPQATAFWRSFSELGLCGWGLRFRFWSLSDR